jgi:23S rRNA (cytosine1962-C5)-methyltransferase
MDVLDRFSQELELKFSDALENDECVRLFHGRGKTFEGLDFFNVDFYPPAVFISIFKEKNFSSILKRIRDVVGHNRSVVVQKRFNRLVERDFYGEEIQGPLVCKEGGLKFSVNLLANQNPGLFLDMKLGKEWIRNNSKDKAVLNLFSYTCSVSAYALDGGAKSVLNIDQKKSFLNIGRENHVINNIDKHADFRNWDVRKSINQIAKKGPFDIVFCDPPTNQGKSFYYKNDYPKIIAKSHKLLKEDSLFMACLNTPFERIAYLHNLFQEDERDWELVGEIYSSDDFLEVDKEDGLKIVIYRPLK